MSSLLDQFSTERLLPHEEDHLAKRIASGEEEALTRLVMANMREALLYTSACDSRLDEGTRVSLCYQELCMSARRFKPGRKRFFAFSKPGLRGRMKTHWTSLRLVRTAKEVVSLDVPRKPGPKPRQAQISEEGHELMDEDSQEDAAASPEMKEFLIRDEWHHIRQLAKDRVTDQQWMMIDLVCRGGLTFPEIGKLVGMTKAGAHASYKKAIQKIRSAVLANRRLLL